MGQQEYDNFKRLIKEWLDSHPNEYADFIEEMNDKKFKGFFKVFNVATRLVPKYRQVADKRISDERNPDFEKLENILLESNLAERTDQKKGYWKIIQMVGFVYGQIYYKKEYIHWHEDKRGLAKFQKATESH